MNASSAVRSTVARTEPVRQRRKQARPGELIAAALELFVQRGFAATRLDDVAKRAGVSKGTLYLYFDSKEALFKAAIAEGLIPVLDDIDRMLETFTGGTSELMEALLLHWWRNVGATPLGGIPKLLISEARNFPDIAEYYHQVVVQRGHHLIRRALERGLREKEFRAVDIDATIEILFAPLLMLVVWQHSFGACDAITDHPFRAPEKFLRTHIDLVMHGLRREQNQRIEPT
jgi:AcrR family transcriptional regulator